MCTHSVAVVSLEVAGSSSASVLSISDLERNQRVIRFGRILVSDFGLEVPRGPCRHSGFFSDGCLEVHVVLADLHLLDGTSSLVVHGDVSLLDVDVVLHEHARVNVSRGHIVEHGGVASVIDKFTGFGVGSTLDFGGAGED